MNSTLSIYVTYLAFAEPEPSGSPEVAPVLVTAVDFGYLVHRRKATEELQGEL